MVRVARVTGSPASLADGWPADHDASRERFARLARAAGARTGSRPLEAVGPGGEALSVDVAALGPERPAHLVVLTGAVHGVEGFLGGHVQALALERLAHRGLPDGVGVACVHAVNPWGFAHLRRVDEGNVDVNRNLFGPGEPGAAPNPGYAALDPLLNPTGPPTLASDLAFRPRALGWIARDRGTASLAKAVAEGQDRFPKGLFFAGIEAGEASRTLQALLAELTSGAGRVTHLDLHTGLGPAGALTPIARTNVGAPAGRVERLRAHYRRPVRLDDAADNPYDARGTLARWYGRALAGVPFLYLCVEIGTVNPLAVLAALRRENRAHHWAAPGSAPHVRARRALVEAFSPDSRRWRERSTAEALHALERTLALALHAREAGA